MLRPLRWYERLALRMLARSPRIDLIHVIQFPGKTAAERKLAAAAHAHQQRVGYLESLYRGPAANH